VIPIEGTDLCKRKQTRRDYLWETETSQLLLQVHGEKGTKRRELTDILRNTNSLMIIPQPKLSKALPSPTMGEVASITSTSRTLSACM
jgi:hypothetical protein